jgi:predicted RNA-binding Zn-ribbon protein involved in translation (DUF1610 family)
METSHGVQLALVIVLGLLLWFFFVSDSKKQRSYDVGVRCRKCGRDIYAFTVKAEHPTEEPQFMLQVTGSPNLRCPSCGQELTYRASEFRILGSH